jgi:Bacterial Ig domain/Gametolysin peptidase M11
MGRGRGRVSLSAARYAVLLCLLSACPFALRAQPARAAVTRSGKLQATVFDDFRHGRSETRYHLRSGEREIALRPTELAAEAGEQVEVTGKMREGKLVGSVEATDASPQTQTVIPGPRKTAVILATFAGESAPWSVETARSEVFTATDSVSAFYEEESYGEISLTGKLASDGDVFGWYSLETPTAGCPYSTWKAKAEEAAVADEVDLSGYQHVIYEFPHQSSCSWLGIAGVGATWAMINGEFFGFRRQATAHELGHNLGLLHAGSWTCTSGGVRVQISDECTVTEYGDPFDVMGNLGLRHSNGWNLAKLGVLTAENIETVESSGAYTLHSAFNKTSEPTVLRVPRKESSGGAVTSWYYLEIRQTGGVFENVSDASTEGVSIRATAEGGSPETLLLDANPGTASFYDAPLGVGETFDGGPVKFKTLSAGGGTATVSVELDEQPPTKPKVQATVGADGVRLSWTSTDNVGVYRYYVFRDGEQLASTFSPSLLDFRVSAGDHEYTVVAEDESGNQSEASDPLTVAVPVVSGPDCAEGKCKLGYRYAGAPSTWTVPPGVSGASLSVSGASGGGGLGGPERGAGSGTLIWATLESLTPEEVAEIVIGGQGEPYSAGGAGGYNGGGDGGLGGGGGGYTAVTLDSTLQALAAGGGGGGLDGVNGESSFSIAGGRGGAGGKEGSNGKSGAQTSAQGATLHGGAGGGKGGAGGAAGAGGAVVNSSSCPGGVHAGAAGAPGTDFAGGGGVASAGGGGGGGYVGGGQGGGGAGDECGATAASGGGGGGSSFVAAHLNGYDTAEGDGRLSIEYDDPIVLAVHSYATEPDQALAVTAADGVLSGASAPAEDPLSLSVVAEPEHGSLRLEDDGSFEYAPAPGYVGEDSFEYRADDSAGDYATATVALTVGKPEPEPEPEESESPEESEPPGGGESPGGGRGDGGGATDNAPAPGPVAESPTPRPAPASPRIAIAAARAPVSHGVAKLPLVCGGTRGGRCRGVVLLSAGPLLGRGRYSIPRGTKRTVRVRLRPAALRRLRRSRRHLLRVRAIFKGAGSQAGRQAVVLHLHTRRSGRSALRKHRSSHHR